MCKEKQVFLEEIIIITSNLTFFLNQNLGDMTEMVELLILGYQQELTMTVKILICFLLKIYLLLLQKKLVLYPHYQIKTTGLGLHLEVII